MVIVTGHQGSGLHGTTERAGGITGKGACSGPSMTGHRVRRELFKAKCISKPLDSSSAQRQQTRKTILCFPSFNRYHRARRAHTPVQGTNPAPSTVTCTSLNSTTFPAAQKKSIGKRVILGRVHCKCQCFNYYW